MDLFQLAEMFFDWIAASERHEDGDIHESIEIHREKGEISEQVAAIFHNTADKLQSWNEI